MNLCFYLFLNQINFFQRFVFTFKKNCCQFQEYFLTMIYSNWPSWHLSRLAIYGICFHHGAHWQLSKTWCSHKWPLVAAVHTFFALAAAGELYGHLWPLVVGHSGLLKIHGDLLALDGLSWCGP